MVGSGSYFLNKKEFFLNNLYKNGWWTFCVMEFGTYRNTNIRKNYKLCSKISIPKSYVEFFWMNKMFVVFWFFWHFAIPKTSFYPGAGLRIFIDLDLTQRYLQRWGMNKQSINFYIWFSLWKLERITFFSGPRSHHQRVCFKQAGQAELQTGRFPHTTECRDTWKGRISSTLYLGYDVNNLFTLRNLTFSKFWSKHIHRRRTITELFFV